MHYYESPAFGEWCSRVYGRDMKQMGAVTTEELQLLYRKVELPSGAQILDVGCGAGYITADVAAHYQSFATGIDIDAEALHYAKSAFKNNQALRFLIMNACQMDFDPQSFDIICFFDTLYITGTIEKLRQLLDQCYRMLKPQGKLVVFWTNHINSAYDIFDMNEPKAEKTQVGIWATERRLQLQTYDLTASHRAFWQRALTELKAMETDLARDVPELYRSILEECLRVEKTAETGKSLYRWLYVINKQ